MATNNIVKISLSVCALICAGSVKADYTYTSLNMNPYALNDNGQAVGQSPTDGGHAFTLYSNGSYTTITPAIDPSFSPSGINNSGQISGNRAYGGGLTQAFIYSNGSTTLVNPPFSNASITGINDNGQYTGTYDWNSFGSGDRSYLYSGGVYTNILVPGATATQAADINNSAQIAGTYYNATGTHGFFYNGSSFIDIDDPNAASNGRTYVTGINDKQQIVGYYLDAESTTKGFLYQNGVFTDVAYLNAPAGASIQLYDINNNGEIAGVMYYLDSNNNYQSQGFLATPEVPLPGAAWLFGSGVIGLFGATRRRKI